MEQTSFGHSWIFMLAILVVIAVVIIIAHKEDIADFFTEFFSSFHSKKHSHDEVEASIRRAFSEHYKVAVKKADANLEATKDNIVERRFVAILEANVNNPFMEASPLAYSWLPDDSALKKIADEEMKKALYEYCGIKDDSGRILFMRNYYIKSRNNEA